MPPPAVPPPAVPPALPPAVAPPPASPPLLPPAPPAVCPLVHAWAVHCSAAGQLRHSAPSRPHAESVVPSRHTSLEQHPRHDSTVQRFGGAPQLPTSNATST